MTIKEIQQKYIINLQDIYSSGEANAITDIIFENTLQISRWDIVIKGSNTVDESLKNKLYNILERLLQKEPPQYIVGNSWFYNLNFVVTNAVLIPRPETEELVLEAITFLKTNDGKKVLDIGTGSGCIPISIKKNIEGADVYALEVSNDALGVAKVNAELNKTTVNFLQIDFLEEKNHPQLSVYDLIVSNPPYIPDTEVLDKNVHNYEPHLALFVPENDVFIFYNKIIAFAENHLAKKGKIMLEVHENLAKETARLFTEKDYEVIIKKDMQQKERMLIISRYQ